MSGSPNIDGFVAAQNRLREKLGMDVTVYAPIAPTYPPGTILDPDSGLPYDPSIEPLGSGFVSDTLRASVLNKHLRPEDETETNAAGIFQATSVVLNIAVDDWPRASAATEFEVLERRYVIRDAYPDGLGNRTTRWLIFGERK